MTALAETALVLSFPSLPFGRLLARGSRRALLPEPASRPVSRPARTAAGFGSALVLDRWLGETSGEALSRALARAAAKNRPVLVGAAVDPYGTTDQPASPRRLLGHLAAAQGLGISLLTGSPRVAGDLDLLIELDLRHSVSVRLGLPAAEPAAGAVWETATRLAREGLAVAVSCRPPAVSGRELEVRLQLLFERALAAGITDLTTDRTLLPHREREPLGALFERLRLQHGFPRVLPGRS